MHDAHDVRGEKSGISKESWGRKKDGVYGWIYKKQTVYRCSFMATEVGAQSPTEKKNREMVSSTQGLDDQTTETTLDRISGVDIGGAGPSED